MWIAGFFQRCLITSAVPLTPGSGVPKLPKTPWVYRASPWQVQLAAVALAIVVFVVVLVVDTMLYRTQTVSAVPVFAISGALAAVLAACFALSIMRHANERRQAVHERLRMVAELNHHIRNALHIIQLSAHTTKDAQAMAIINEAAIRVDWALREILAVDPHELEVSGKLGSDMPVERERPPRSHSPGGHGSL